VVALGLTSTQLARKASDGFLRSGNSSRRCFAVYAAAAVSKEVGDAHSVEALTADIHPCQVVMPTLAGSARLAKARAFFLGIWGGGKKIP